MIKKYTNNISNRKLLMNLSVATLALVCYLIFAQINSDKKLSIEQTKSDLKRITYVISSNVELGFITVDQTLQRAAERQYFNILFGKSLKEDMMHNMAIWVNSTPHIEAMMIVDESRIVDVLYSKDEHDIGVKEGELFNIGNHFYAQKNNENAGSIISKSLITGSNDIFISRRIDTVEGGFGGIAVAVIDGNYLESLLKSVDGNQDLDTYIYTSDNTLLLGDVSGNKKEMFNAATSEHDVTHSTDDKNISIVERYVNDEFAIFAFDKLKNIPLSIAIMKQGNSFGNQWQTKKNNYIIFGIVFSLFILTIGFLVRLLDKQVQQSKDSEKKAIIASQTKSDFLAKMSHELRTPLNAIIGFSDMLSGGYFGKFNSAQAERIADISMCGHHLLELITDILDFSKGEVGKLKLKEDIVNIYSLINQSLRIVEQKAKIKNIKLVNNTKRNINSIYADKKKIQQIILNLLSNSVKFTPEAGSIAISAYLNSDGCFVIQVTDTGIGIAQDDIPKALSLFEQVNKDMAHEGTGLGLPLSKMFTELHGGQFRLESKQGSGTTIFIIMPKERVRKPIFEEEMALT